VAAAEIKEEDVASRNLSFKVRVPLRSSVPFAALPHPAVKVAEYVRHLEVSALCDAFLKWFDACFGDVQFTDHLNRQTSSKLRIYFNRRSRRRCSSAAKQSSVRLGGGSDEVLVVQAAASAVGIFKDCETVL
jgi:hypothetical protein